MSMESACKCGRPIPREALEQAVAEDRSIFCNPKHGGCGHRISAAEAANRLARIADGVDEADDKIQLSFEQFDTSHPDIFEMFKRFANELRCAGRARYGAKSIMERIRWEVATSSAPDADGFKINNNFTSRYARKLIAESPSYDGFFETRCLAVNRG